MNYNGTMIPQGPFNTGVMNAAQSSGSSCEQFMTGLDHASSIWTFLKDGITLVSGIWSSNNPQAYLQSADRLLHEIEAEFLPHLRVEDITVVDKFAQDQGLGSLKELEEEVESFRLRYRGCLINLRTYRSKSFWEFPQHVKAIWGFILLLRRFCKRCKDLNGHVAATSQQVLHYQYERRRNQPVTQQPQGHLPEISPSAGMHRAVGGHTNGSGYVQVPMQDAGSRYQYAGYNGHGAGPSRRHTYDQATSDAYNPYRMV